MKVMKLSENYQYLPKRLTPTTCWFSSSFKTFNGDKVVLKHLKELILP